MGKFITPDRAQVAKLFRRGGSLDRLQLHFVCEQCCQKFKLSGRQAYKLTAPPACPTCGPGTKIMPAPKRIHKKRSGQHLF